MPVKQGLIAPEEFFKTVEKKIRQAAAFRDDLALTALSQNAPDLQDQYPNVYLKGALTGLCLDLLLRSQSAGKYGAQELLRDLAARYGPTRPFRDEELFDVIAELTGPETRAFFRRHVEGTEPLPLAGLLARAGIRLERGRLEVDKAATEAQVALRRAWLGQ
jgi:predicted metalloprotease with PDZ domain